MDSVYWAVATASAFNALQRKECHEVAKPEWWSDKGLKALSARVIRAAPNDLDANKMRANVLCGLLDCFREVAAPRSAEELKEAAALYKRMVALSNAPASKVDFARLANWCRSEADAM